MKIEITENSRKVKLLLPNALIFNGLTLRLANGTARKYAPKAMACISPEALEVLFTQIKRIRKKRGSWVLVEMESASGEYIKITL